MYSLISAFLENWNSYYANHALVRTLIAFFHIGGLVIGGGCAITADRLILQASRREPSERKIHLQTLKDSHRIVLISLAVVSLSGLLLFAADSATFFHSVWFWLKMGLLAALMTNGLFLTRAEQKAAKDVIGGWRALTITSTLSLALWLITTLAGAALPNIG
jgi:hypothetical protein